MPLFRPAKPKIKVGLLADTSIASGSQQVPFDETVWFEGGASLLVGGQVEVERPGLFLIQGSVSRASAAISGQVQARIQVNGADAPNSPTVLPNVSSAVHTFQVTDMIPLAAGDLVGLRVQLSNAIAVNARRTGTYLTVCRIGPERWT